MNAKAMICRELGPPEQLVHDDIRLSDPGPGEALIRIRAAGVNFPDKLIVAGGYQLKPPLPFVPGTEVAGEIVTLGPTNGAAPPNHVRPGGQVMATMRIGAYAEAAVVPLAAIRPIPDGFSLSQAAAHPVGAQTAYVSLVERGGLAAGETVLILGAAGGVGLAAVQLAKALGATVIAAGSTPDKRDAAVAAGADHAIDPTSDLKTAVMDLTKGRGADLVYDPVGGDAFDQAIRTLAWGGRYLVVGFASGRIPSFAVNRALIKGISVIGVRAGEYVRQRPDAGPRIHQAIDALAARGQLVPRIHAELPLTDAAKALRMLDRREVIGKLVLVT
jgi:NADPH2:quinone reductase